MTTTVKGRTTFRVAAVLFGLSAILELLSFQSETLLFGQFVSGTAVAAYHIFYFALFGWLTIGLWNGSRSGYYTLFTATVIYTIDRLQVVFARDALASMLRQQFEGHEDLLQMVGLDYLLQVMTLITIVFVLCWWGFFAYAYYRREYFGIPPAAKT